MVTTLVDDSGDGGWGALSMPVVLVVVGVVRIDVIIEVLRWWW